MRLVDGGLATTLQERGLQPFTPVDEWILRRPAEVQDAHARFVEAGAELLLTGTFRALPELQPRWEAVADGALEVAVRASRGRAEVWGSIGPASTAQRAWRPADRPGWARLAARLAPEVTGFVLETFADPDEAAAALAAVRELGPAVVLLTVRADGLLYSGAPPEPALAGLLERGAQAVGVGCGEPAGARAVVEAWDGPGLWARPGRFLASEDEWLSTATQLAGRCAVLGGCCGVSPTLLASLSQALGRTDG